jgi:hypothetical protein
MKIETPFGPMTLQFIRKNHCILHANELDYIIVNNVKLQFSKEFACFDNGDWKMISKDGSGEFFVSSMIALRFKEWQRNKVRNWIEAFFLVDLNNGTYTQQMKDAEHNFYKNEIKNYMTQIAETKNELGNLEKQLEFFRKTLENLPV